MQGLNLHRGQLMLSINKTHKAILLNTLNEQNAENTARAFAIENPFGENIIVTCASLVKASPYPIFKFWKSPYIQTEFSTLKYGLLTTTPMGHYGELFKSEQTNDIIDIQQNINLAFFRASELAEDFPILSIQHHEDDLLYVEMHGHTCPESYKLPKQPYVVTGTYIQDDNCGYILNASKHVYSGMLGAPVLNAKGNVIAVVSKVITHLPESYVLKQLSTGQTKRYCLAKTLKEETDVHPYKVSVLCTPVSEIVHYMNKYLCKVNESLQ